VFNPSLKDWGTTGPRTYLVLRQDANPVAFGQKIEQFYNARSPNPPGFHVEMYIQRFSDMYLHSAFQDGNLSGGRIEYVNLFSIIALFILVIACINFMNLSTARSVKRAKEIGVRKVAGAGRAMLIGQFVGEAMLFSGIAALFAIIIVYLSLPAFNNLTGKQIQLPFARFSFIAGLAVLVVATGIFAGSYPAIFLSSFNPIKVLKARFAAGNRGAIFRKSLVVFQFALSIAMIISTAVVWKQVNYIQSTNLGYDKDNILCIPVEGELQQKFDIFKAEALSLPDIESITHLTEQPAHISGATTVVQWPGKHVNGLSEFTVAGAGYDFIKTLKLSLLEGRGFAKEYPGDTTGFVLNEEAVAKIGYKDPIGKPLTVWNLKGTIIGVVKNFHNSSLQNPIDPFIFYSNEQGGRKPFGFALVRIKAGQTRQAIAGLENTCKALNPKFPFTFNFADEQFQTLYTSEMLAGKLSGIFAFLGILISCLGLLGLAMFIAERKTKEIGIRKVLGARVGSLFALLSREFVGLICIALFIAMPAAYYFMHNWLQQYAYRTTLSWWVFALTAIAALGITLLTVSYHSIKAALTNPVKSLRAE